jgi:PAS domain S-box-containing protein
MTTSEAVRHIESVPAAILEGFIDAMPQMAFIADAKGVGRYMNRRHYEYFGVRVGDLEGWREKEKEARHPDDLDETLKRWNEALRTGTTFETEYRLKRQDGAFRWHLGRAVPLLDDAGRIAAWFGTNTDIHEQKEHARRLREERELREQFVAMLSHDLRTPLAAAKGSAALLLRKGSDPGAVYKLATRISDNVDRAVRMIQDLLDTSRIRAGQQVALELVRCSLNGLLEETLEELSQIHGDRFVLTAPEAIEGNWSPTALRRILENLCNNAVHYGSAERKVSIQASKIDPASVAISIHNWGNPISMEDQEILFEPYRRLGPVEVRSQKGWGLGLTLVKGLAQAHGGSVEVTSTAEAGTTFTVRLPLDASGIPGATPH